MFYSASTALMQLLEHTEHQTRFDAGPPSAHVARLRLPRLRARSRDLDMPAIAATPDCAQSLTLAKASVTGKA